jgi:hypothetical protein
MINRFIRALLMFAALPAIANVNAANPHDGKWSMVESKSNWSDGRMPKGMRLTIDLKFGENRLEYHSLNDTRPERPYRVDYITTLDGTPSSLAQQSRYNKISVSKTGPHTYQILKILDDDVIVGEFWSFDPNGHSLIRRGVGKSPEGKSKAFTEYFERK